MSRQCVVVDGVTLAYEEYGSGQPILFVHGFPASSYSWRQVAQGLADSNRCICIDMMGFGYSDKPRRADYSVERQAELIAGAVRELGLESVILSGHSLGGGVCLGMMREWGASAPVAGVVLVNTICYPQKLPWFIAAVRVPVLPKLAMKLIPERLGFRVLAPWMYHPRNGMSPGAMREYAGRLHSPGGHDALITVSKGMVPKDIESFTASYKSISVPTLIIWGKQDRTIPVRFAGRLAGDIGGSILCEVDECGHCPQEEKPEETLVHLRRFVEAVRN